MKKTGILFQTEMVQAIHQDKKTQTRRTRGLEKINENPDEWIFERFDGLFFHFIDKTGTQCIALSSPYGLAGDWLWVRETFCPTPDSKPLYKANGCSPVAPLKWKPSIHMPKKFTRFWLQIESITIQRIEDISEEDAIAEGILQINTEYKDYITGGETSSAYWSFYSLWYQINGHDSWKKAPWVWVIKFKKYRSDEMPEM